MALQGLLLFCLNYVLFYWAAADLVSGLLAVCFSTMTVMNIVIGALLFRRRVDPIVAVAALLGLVGLALVFWPELAHVELSGKAAIGLALSLGGTVSASLGNMVTVRHKAAGVPVVQGNTIGMAYGTLFSFAIVLARGIPLQFDGSSGYVGSLLYLSLFATVLGFGCYLTLVQRIGPDRAAYTTVLFPLVALAVSTVLENYHWTVMAAFGVALVLAGNLLLLVQRRPAPVLPALPLPAAARAGKWGAESHAAARASRRARARADPPGYRGDGGFADRRGMEARLRHPRCDRPVGRRGRSADAGLHLR